MFCAAGPPVAQTAGADSPYPPPHLSPASRSAQSRPDENSKPPPQIPVLAPAVLVQDPPPRAALAAPACTRDSTAPAARCNLPERQSRKMRHARPLPQHNWFPAARPEDTAHTPQPQFPKAVEQQNKGEGFSCRTPTPEGI